MNQLSLYTQINALPPKLKQEVVEFIQKLTENSEPKASKKTREFGVLKDKIWMSDDFDAPLDDFKDYM